jgi:hypothetical protein
MTKSDHENEISALKALLDERIKELESQLEQAKVASESSNEIAILKSEI